MDSDYEASTDEVSAWVALASADAARSANAANDAASDARGPSAHNADHP